MNQDDRLGPYRLLRRLGEGGMGVVHLAVDPQGRQVAVKVLRSEVAGDDVARRRLSREVETMRRVRSEYIAEVLDADVTGHRPYIVTRYVAGDPLDEVVKQEGPLDLPALLQVAHGVASALASVHSVGVIHRDLKPGNVLILDGRPVLIDFGIAQAVDATRLTQTGMFIGTPGYLAPEIIEGHEAGPEVDVHAWAGTLVFAATGQPPFGKGTLEMIFYNITAGRANVDGAPPELQPVLRAALQRDPSKRPPAAELAAETARLMARTGGGRPRVPDEITTVPSFDDPVPGGRGGTGGHAGPGGRGGTGGRGAGGHGAPAGAGAGAGAADFATGSLLPADPGDVPTPVSSRPAGPAPSTPWPPAARPGEYSSLLDSDQPDPWPTRRVTSEELRQAGAPSPSARPSHDLPTGLLGQEDVPTTRAPGRDRTGQAGQGGAGRAGRSGPDHGVPDHGGPGRPAGPHGSGAAGLLGPTAPVPDGDIPTQRVRPQDLPEHMRGPGPSPQSHRQPQQPPSHPYRQSQQQPYPPHASFEQPHASFERTPHVRPAATPQYPYPPADRHGQAAPGPFHPDGRQVQGPGHQGHHGRQGQPERQGRGHAVQPSGIHSVASALLLVVVAVAAVVFPVLVWLAVIPVVILLRAADIAQPRLNARRPAGEAAADVLRVLAMPGALLKSAGVTAALVPYGLILGLPVTLLLAVLVPRMPAVNALGWGAAIALATVCAGPGVEGPGRQTRRTLASLVPSRNGAVAVAAALGVVAALTVYLAGDTVGTGARKAEWRPADVGTVVKELDGLRRKAR
ncbi:serine/threonine-protein kinase [Planomonospora sphaerica]|nr:serine/threonine-protein kinase [Planomonospora sphaerica]